MSTTIVRTIGPESEAGKLQADLRNIFEKMLTHARRIDSSMKLGDTSEALGQLKELEAYLERGLEVIVRPLGEES